MVNKLERIRSLLGHSPEVRKAASTTEAAQPQQRAPKDGRHRSGVLSAQGGRGASDKASPAAVVNYLRGIHFPATKADLTRQAQSNGAPADVMHVIGSFDDKRSFASVIEITKHVGEKLRQH